MRHHKWWACTTTVDKLHVLDWCGSYCEREFTDFWRRPWPWLLMSARKILNALLNVSLLWSSSMRFNESIFCVYNCSWAGWNVASCFAWTFQRKSCLFAELYCAILILHNSYDVNSKNSPSILNQLREGISSKSVNKPRVSSATSSVQRPEAAPTAINSKLLWRKSFGCDRDRPN